MGEDNDTGVILAQCADFFRREALVHLAVAVEKDDDLTRFWRRRSGRSIRQTA